MILFFKIAVLVCSVVSLCFDIKLIDETTLSKNRAWLLFHLSTLSYGIWWVLY